MAPLRDHRRGRGRRGRAGPVAGAWPGAAVRPPFNGSARGGRGRPAHRQPPGAQQRPAGRPHPRRALRERGLPRGAIAPLPQDHPQARPAPSASSAAAAAGSSYRRKNPSLCPQVASRRSSAPWHSSRPTSPAAGRGRSTSTACAISSVLLPTGKVLWWAYPGKPDFTPPHTPASDEAINYAEAYVFDPATNTSVRRDPPTDPRTGKPFNIWCAGQTLLPDGRVVVAGGNLTYYSSASPKYRGLDVVLTFNPFNETWTYQGRMRDGRWYPTLAELPDGRVIIVAGLDSRRGQQRVQQPRRRGVHALGRHERRRHDRAQAHGGALLRALPAPVRDARAGRCWRWARRAPTRRCSTPATWTWQDTPNFSVRREWGTAVPLPSGPRGPSTIMMIGGSNTDIDYSNAPAHEHHPPGEHHDRRDLGRAVQHPRAAATSTRVILPDGKLLTVGGGIGSDNGSLYEGPVYTAELYDPATGTWTETDPQADARTYHSTALLLPDGRVISIGDDRQATRRTCRQRTLEFYSPPYLFKGARPTITSAPAGRRLRHDGPGRDPRRGRHRQGRAQEAGRHHARGQHGPALAGDAREPGDRRRRLHHPREPSMRRRPATTCCSWSTARACRRWRG